MRHLKAGRKLNRSPSHRLALMRNLVTSLLRHEKIHTTDAKAKELRRWADWMIGLGKEGSLHARRQAFRVIRDRAVVHKLFDTLAHRFKDRSGGYTRAVRVGWRRGDHAPVSVIELLPADTTVKAGASSSEKGRRKRRSPAKKGAGPQQRSSRRKATPEPSAGPADTA